MRPPSPYLNFPFFFFFFFEKEAFARVSLPTRVLHSTIVRLFSSLYSSHFRSSVKELVADGRCHFVAKHGIVRALLFKSELDCLSINCSENRFLQRNRNAQKIYDNTQQFDWKFISKIKMQLTWSHRHTPLRPSSSSRFQSPKHPFPSVFALATIFTRMNVVSQVVVTQRTSRGKHRSSSSVVPDIVPRWR